MKHFYVYALVNMLDGKVFYVGKGSEGRFEMHRYLARAGNPLHVYRKIRKIWQYGGEIEEKILLETDNEDVAFEMERVWIKRFGRENLTNSTDGGEGVRGHIPTKETRLKRSIALRGKVRSPESIERYRLAAKRRMQNPEYYQKALVRLKLLHKKAKGGHHTAEAKEKIRVAMTGRKCSAEMCEKMRAIMLNRSPEVLEKIRQSNLGKIRSAETRAKISLGHKGIKHPPRSQEFCDAQSVRMKQWHDDRKANGLRWGHSHNSDVLTVAA